MITMEEFSKDRENAIVGDQSPHIKKEILDDERIYDFVDKYMGMSPKDVNCRSWMVMRANMHTEMIQMYATGPTKNIDRADANAILSECMLLLSALQENCSFYYGAIEKDHGASVDLGETGAKIDEILARYKEQLNQKQKNGK